MDQTFRNPKPHLQQVDYIRAIASLAVALFHLGGKTLPVLKYGWLGVEMFFLLSGFIICWSLPEHYSWRMSGTFIGKRLLRIEPPYLVSVLMALLINLLGSRANHPGLIDVLCHIAYLNNFTGRPYLSPVYWTLGIEFQYYIFIAFCFPFLVKKWGVYLIPALCLLPAWFPFPGSTLGGVFSFFGLGIIYYFYLSGKKAWPELLIIGILVTAVCVFENGWLPASAGLLALGILALPLKGNRVVAFFSRISFSLYLTHDLVGSNWVVFIGSKLPKTIIYKALEFSSGILISVLFAFLFYKLVEEPCLKYAKRLIYPKP